MIRVLVVESTVFGYDGITNVMTNYYTYLDHSKIHMDIVTINPVSEKFKRILEKNGSKNYVLPFRNKNPIKYISVLKKILKKGEYDIIHVHGCSATMAVEMFAAKQSGVKVRIAHSHNTTCDHVKIDKLLRPFFDSLCNVGFACGQEAGKWLFPKKSFTVISNGIDLDKYQFNNKYRKEIREQFELENKIIIGHVGRFSEQKNHRKLIDIFREYGKRHDNAKLVLIGDGELREEIENRVKNEKLDVIFVGITDEVYKWLQAMDIIVFPSLFEGLPLGLVEAQAAGLPCVLSNTISPATKITDNLEFIGLDSSLIEWTSEIDELLAKTDREKPKEIIRKTIQHAHFDIKQNCDELAEKYEELLSIV